MNDEQARALGERAVACAGWRWMPGMHVLHPPSRFPAPRIVLYDHGADCPFLRCSTSDVVRVDAIPDLRDPATIGCLLALVREAWDDDYLTCVGHASYGDWTVQKSSGAPRTKSYNSEAEALVAALEAAPPRR